MLLDGMLMLVNPIDLLDVEKGLDGSWLEVSLQDSVP